MINVSFSIFTSEHLSLILCWILMLDIFPKARIPIQLPESKIVGIFVVYSFSSGSGSFKTGFFGLTLNTVSYSTCLQLS